MNEVTVIIPNYNGMKYLEKCLYALEHQKDVTFNILIVDNGSSDGSADWIRQHYSQVKLICFEKNYGFCKAVNAGIRASKTPYVILLNNDTEPEPHFVWELLRGMKKHPRAFSCSAKMLQFQNKSLIDDAGNEYNALGWAYARGKDKPESGFDRSRKVFACCAGAAIYRKELFEKTGYFDEEHFAYLEDVDLGYRARILGYENWYLPKARVCHVGSGTSGSRYNLFKVRYSARNNIYMIYKNMPVFQIVLNAPLLFAGFAIKAGFFYQKGFFWEYMAGMKQGFALCREKKEKKVAFRWKNLLHYVKIQIELWMNVFRRLVV